MVEKRKKQSSSSEVLHRSWDKFAEQDNRYFRYIEWLEKQGFGEREVIFNFPVFVGEVNLGRHLMFYDLYNRTKDLSGDIADVGTYKGASFLFMAKLVALFERNTVTQVHGFDWFKGMKPGKRDAGNMEGRYLADYRTLQELIRHQGLTDVAVLHRMDLTQAFAGFLESNPQLRFKLSFVDCGIESVLRSVIRPLWERTLTGGIMILDHYGNDPSPMESSVVDEVVRPCKVKRVPYARQPTGYVVKE